MQSAVSSFGNLLKKQVESCVKKLERFDRLKTVLLPREVILNLWNLIFMIRVSRIGNALSSMSTDVCLN